LLVVSGITFLSCIGLYLLLNAIFNNTRPRETDELNFPPDMNVDWSPTIGNSFPSGHTMGAFAGGI
jgi:membrane-associated phospholipid phosphatase